MVSSMTYTSAVVFLPGGVRARGPRGWSVSRCGADRAGQTGAGRAAPPVLSSPRRQTLRATNDSQAGAQENHFQNCGDPPAGHTEPCLAPQYHIGRKPFARLSQDCPSIPNMPRVHLRAQQLSSFSTCRLRRLG